jgi:hypothetical protein
LSLYWSYSREFCFWQKCYLISVYKIYYLCFFWFKSSLKKFLNIW